MAASFEDISFGLKLSTDQSFAYETLVCVFSYLTPGELFRASRVCRLWNWIVTDRSLWSSKILRSCGKHMEAILEEFGERATKVGLYDLYSYDTEALVNLLKKYPNIRVLILQECDKTLLENLDRANKNIKEVHASQVLDGYRLIVEDFSLDFVKNMFNLKVLDVSSWCGKVVLKSLSCLKDSQIDYLQARSSSIKDWKGLSEVQGLKTLALEGSAEDIDCPVTELVTTLKNLKNLNSLHLEMYASFDEYEGYSIYSSALLNLVKELPKLTELHLRFLYNFNDQADPNNFIKSLSSCSNIKILYVSFGPGEGTKNEHLYEIANTTSIFLKALANLQQLSKLTYTFSRMHLKVIHKYAGNNQSFTAILKPNIPLNTWKMHASKMIQLVDRESFKNMLKNTLPNTQVNIIVHPKNTLEDNGCLICALTPENEPDEASSEPESEVFDREILYGSGSEMDCSDESSSNWESYSETSSSESDYEY